MKPMTLTATKVLFGATIISFAFSMLAFITAIGIGQGRAAAIGAVLLFVWIVVGISWLLCWYHEPDPRPENERQNIFDGY